MVEISEHAEPDHSSGNQLPLGLIDIHSHLIPAIDDGCIDVTESVKAIQLLIRAGYVGSICTPHIWPQQFPRNTAPRIEELTRELDSQLNADGITYQLWSGGEVRLYEGIVDWLKVNGVPTLACSPCVLTDLWDGGWNRWVIEVFEWLLANHYQPILAHPERMPPSRGTWRMLQDVVQMGVWLQGNFRSFTGEEGYNAGQLVRQLVFEQQFKFMALDAHRPGSLVGRFDGMQLMVEECGQAVVDELTMYAPRRHIFGMSQ